MSSGQKVMKDGWKVKQNVDAMSVWTDHIITQRKNQIFAVLVSTNFYNVFGWVCTSHLKGTNYCQITVDLFLGFCGSHKTNHLTSMERTEWRIKWDIVCYLYPRRTFYWFLLREKAPFVARDLESLFQVFIFYTYTHYRSKV